MNIKVSTVLAVWKLSGVPYLVYRPVACTAKRVFEHFRDVSIEKNSSEIVSFEEVLNEAIAYAESTGN